MRYVFVLLLVFILNVTCEPKKKRLPILGRKEIKNVEFNGGIMAETIYHTIAEFIFTNQEGERVTNETFRGKVDVADFFFTSCPTICPIMKTQMLRVYEQFKDIPEVMMLSHTIDPEHDSVEVLHEFADRLGVSADKWHFVTGDMEDIYDIGQNSYMVTAREDPDEPGGYLHSGAFLIVDKERRIRGIYDGTVPEKVDLLMEDLEILLKEYTTE